VSRRALLWDLCYCNVALEAPEFLVVDEINAGREATPLFCIVRSNDSVQLSIFLKRVLHTKSRCALVPVFTSHVEAEKTPTRHVNFVPLCTFMVLVNKYAKVHNQNWILVSSCLLFIGRDWPRRN
jgi:hypothetical protein